MGEELRRLLDSGFVQDTLFQITGEPAQIEQMRPRPANMHPKIAGRFFPSEDRMQIQPDQSEEDLARTVAHESGHRFQDSLQAMGRQRDSNFLSSVADRRGALEQLDDPSHAQQYAASSQNEHFAVAFQRALQALRTPAGEGRQEQIQEAEREIPGAQAVADFLLGLPPFRN